MGGGLGWRTNLWRNCLLRRTNYLRCSAVHGVCPQDLCNPFNNGIDIAHYFGIPESQHAISVGAQELASAFVLHFLIGVLRTINFDDQSRFQADEIDEERSNRVLPT